MNKQQIIDNMSNTVYIDVITTIKLKGGKKNEHQGRITKHITGLQVKIVTPAQYMEAKQSTDPSFQLKNRPWGTRLDNGLIEHKGQFYVELQIINAGNKHYCLDNETINKDNIIGLNEQTNPTENDEVIIRTYKLESIERLYKNQH